MTAYRLLLWSFPRAWRTRYARELLGLLEDQQPASPLSACTDLVRTGVGLRAERLAPRVPRPRLSPGTNIVKFKSAAALASETRRKRVARWAVAVIPLATAATVVPLTLGPNGTTGAARPVAAATVDAALRDAAAATRVAARGSAKGHGAAQGKLVAHTLEGHRVF